MEQGHGTGSGSGSGTHGNGSSELHHHLNLGDVFNFNPVSSLAPLFRCLKEEGVLDREKEKAKEALSGDQQLTRETSTGST